MKVKFGLFFYFIALYFLFLVCAEYLPSSDVNAQSAHFLSSNKITTFPDKLSCKNGVPGKLVNKNRKKIFQSLKRGFRIANGNFTLTKAEQKKIKISKQRCASLNLPQTYYVDKLLSKYCTKYSPVDRKCRNGSELSFPSLKEALKWTGPGDLVLLRGGEYIESVKLSVSGNSSAPITIASYNNELANISGQNKRSTGVTISGSFIKIQNLKFTNFKFHKKQGAVFIQNGNFVTLNNLNFYDNQGNGAVLAANVKNSFINRNIFHKIAGSGISFFEGSGHTISNNIIFDVLDSGIKSQSILNKFGAPDLIHHNVVIFSQRYGIDINTSFLNSTNASLYAHNLLSNNTLSGLSVKISGGTGDQIPVIIKNSILAGNNESDFSGTINNINSNYVTDNSIL